VLIKKLVKIRRVKFFFENYPACETLTFTSSFNLSSVGSLAENFHAESLVMVLWKSVVYFLLGVITSCALVFSIWHGWVQNRGYSSSAAPVVEFRGNREIESVYYKKGNANQTLLYGDPSTTTYHHLMVNRSTKVVSQPAVKKVVLLRNIRLSRNYSVSCHGTTFQPSLDNLFLYHAVCNISHGSNIVNFSGQRIRDLFDSKNEAVHLKMEEKLRTPYWSQAAKLMINTYTNATAASHSLVLKSAVPRALHVHNYNKIGDFLLMFHAEHYRLATKAERKQGKTKFLTKAQFDAAMEQGQPPMVLTNWGDENWGFLSGRKLFVCNATLAVYSYHGCYFHYMQRQYICLIFLVISFYCYLSCSYAYVS
jgi:hypothetical protein